MNAIGMRACALAGFSLGAVAAALWPATDQVRAVARPSAPAIGRFAHAPTRTTRDVVSSAAAAPHA